MSPMQTVGIDLGTTCSALGWVEEGRPRLLEVEGDPLVPSVVHFPTEGTPLVGRAAVNRLVLEPERTIRSTKRHMGTDHRWTIDGRELAARDVAALVLGHLADAAAHVLGERPEHAVITVPAWFSNAARADTRRAAEMAELEVARLINEPTAAALAHAHGQDVRRRALVFDLGGGTFDASLIDQDGDLVEVRASHGDTHLGGDDLDQALLELSVQDVHMAVRASRPARVRLLEALREAKHRLSAELETSVRVPFLLDHDGESLHHDGRLGREMLEELARPLIGRCLECVDRVLEEAGCKPEQVEELLLVGGSTRIPLVWHALHQHYGWEGRAAIEPDRAVGLGAAVQAAMIDGQDVESILIDVAPHPLSVAASDASDRYYSCQVITPRNAPLPARHTQRFWTGHPLQTGVHIPVLQGASPNPLRNVALGAIQISDLPPAPAGEGQRPIAVEIRHDLDGMVTIRVTDELSGRSVDGQVVSGGDEVAEVRESMVRTMRMAGLEPGDGTDPDPWLEREPREATVEPTPAPPPASPDLDEARAAFDEVARRGDSLPARSPEAAGELARLATAGVQAIEKGDGAQALRLYDELSDRLFEQGIFL